MLVIYSDEAEIDIKDKDTFVLRVITFQYIDNNTCFFWKYKLSNNEAEIDWPTKGQSKHNGPEWCIMNTTIIITITNIINTNIITLVWCICQTSLSFGRYPSLVWGQGIFYPLLYSEGSSVEYIWFYILFSGSMKSHFL